MIVSFRYKTEKPRRENVLREDVKLSKLNLLYLGKYGKFLENSVRYR